MEDIPLDNVVATVPLPQSPPGTAIDQESGKSAPEVEQRVRKLRDAWFTGVQFLDNAGIESKWTVIPASETDARHERIRVHWFEDMFRAQTMHFGPSGPSGLSGHGEKPIGDVLAETILNRPSLLNLCWGTRYAAKEDLCGTRIIETFPGNLSLIEFSLRRPSFFPWVSAGQTRALIGLFWYRHDPSKQMHMFLFHEHSTFGLTPGARFCLLIRTPVSVAAAGQSCLAHVTVYASNSLGPSGGDTSAAAEHWRATLLGWDETLIK
jgi:hypothetical protein